MAFRELTIDECSKVAGGEYFLDQPIDDGGGGGGGDGSGYFNGEFDTSYPDGDGYEFEVTGEAEGSSDSSTQSLSRREVIGILRYGGMAIGVAAMFSPDRRGNLDHPGCCLGLLGHELRRLVRKQVSQIAEDPKRPSLRYARPLHQIVGKVRL
jgi:hypothetical protein